jgi:hypothetical protein
LVIDRDLNSAIKILKIGIKEVEKPTIKNLPMDSWEVTPVEWKTTMKQEAPDF